MLSCCLHQILTLTLPLEHSVFPFFDYWQFSALSWQKSHLVWSSAALIQLLHKQLCQIQAQFELWWADLTMSTCFIELTTPTGFHFIG